MGVASAPAAGADLLARLSDVCDQRGLDGLAERLRALGEGVAHDMAATEAALGLLPRGASLVHKSATHLLDLGGKRLRPLCVALAARCGRGYDAAARELAVAVELVHTATLLHDDVVDLGAVRRNVATARVVYGNAASIFAGDWLLVEALRRVRVADVPGALDRLLGVIEEMIFAESLQLEARGRLTGGRPEWLRVVEGKTAALFRWAMWAGARAGGLGEYECAALEAYGRHLGVAFQVIDDVLDFAGDPAVTGKALLTDLAEGKLTYPLIVALEREPGLRALLEAVLAGDGVVEAGARVVAVLRATGAIDAGRALAEERAHQAAACLGVLPAGRARQDLETIAEATVRRDK